MYQFPCINNNWNTNTSCQTNRNNQSHVKTFSNTVHFSCTIILSGECHHCCSKCTHRQPENTFQFIDRCPRCNNIRSKFINLGLDDNVGHRIHRILTSRWKTNFYNLYKDFAVRFSFFENKTIRLFCTNQCPKDKSCTDRMGDNCCQSCTKNPKIQVSYKQNI